MIRALFPFLLFDLRLLALTVVLKTQRTTGQIIKFLTKIEKTTDKLLMKKIARRKKDCIESEDKRKERDSYASETNTTKIKKPLFKLFFLITCLGENID